MSLFIKDKDYKIIYKRIKNINLRVNRDGEIVVSAPFNTSEIVIDTFVNKHYDKILKAQKRRNDQISKLDEPIEEKCYLWILGKKHQFEKVRDTKFSYSISENKIVLYYRNLTNDYDKMIKELAIKIFDNLNDIVVSKINCNKVPVAIRKYKNCYGKNIEKREIVLNYKLVHMDTKYIKHVLFHEYAHMKEFNHSRKFYNVLSMYDEDYKQNKKYLDENFHKYL